MVRNRDAAWEFPKGSIETGEEEQGAARREIWEETGIEAVELLPDFRDQVEYRYRRNGNPVQKTVVFFLGEVTDWSPMPEVPPSREHVAHPEIGAWYLWLNERDALNRLFHPGMRNLLARASFFLHEYDRIQRLMVDPGGASQS